ncbi:glycosyltransferase [Candidatus Pacearchaeota archaeon]|nr:glycosyltransferase [Candidatus Pacearchaeota archaeon]
MENILHIAPPVIPVSEDILYAGTERIVLALNKIFHEQGYNSFVAASGDSNLGDYGTLIKTIPRSLWNAKGIERETIQSERFYSDHYRKSLDFAIENEIQIIQDHPGLYLIASKEYNKREVNIPVVTTIHGDVSVEREGEMYEKFKGLQDGKNPVSFVCISNSQKERYENLAGIKIDKMIYNGVPTDELQFNDRKQNYLLWLGRVSSIKGTDLAVKVAQETGIPLIIAGEVHTPDKKFYESKIEPYLTNSITSGSLRDQKIKRQDLIERLREGDQIVGDGEIFFIGPVNNHQKSVLYGNATTLLQPNRWDEPFGLVMAEALATGTPVIGTYTGSIPEVVKENITGYIIRPDWKDNNKLNGFNEESMVRDLVSAVDKIKKINPYDCRKDAEERFGQEVMGKNYLEFYKEILSR